MLWRRTGRSPILGRSSFTPALICSGKRFGKGGNMDPVDKKTEQPVPAASTSDTWKRGLIMLVLIFAFGVGQGLLYLTAIVQFLWLLIARERNGLLAGFGKSLA